MRFAGYAAIFERRDKGGDVIARGAFAESLTRRLAGGDAMPLLWSHDPEQVIGVIETAAEDMRGLRVTGRLTGRGERAAALIRGGAVDGLSFGYRVVDARPAAAPGQARRLETLDIVEVSLVTQPMQPLARVHAVAA